MVIPCLLLIRKRFLLVGPLFIFSPNYIVGLFPQDTLYKKFYSYFLLVYSYWGQFPDLSFSNASYRASTTF